MPKSPQNWLFPNWTKLGLAGTRPCDTPVRTSILLKEHGRVTCPCEEVQVVLISTWVHFLCFWPVSRPFYSSMLT
ncbi:hypothetical protein F383_34931 [Gossypium arboreum]|uniref:Uncharacterized protein n=1 Tax=Gossypium arboreum TaxID=29729 RepID=A0A0B0NA46_GOSAR|nr:hypothetical protein F383_34931 [Gossypium arboreum]